jgi:O-antigen ligase
MIYFFSLILFLLPSYLVRLKIFGLPTTALELLVVVFLFVCLIQFKNWDWKKIKNLGWVNQAAGLFMLAGIISTLVSPDIIKALGQLKAFIIEPILFGYAGLLVIQSEKDLKIALRGLFASVGIISLFGIVQYFTFLHLPLRFWGTGMELERITSVFDYPNALSLYLAPLLGFFAVLFWEKFALIKQKGFYLLGLGLMSVALILTFSRGAWLAVAITFFLLVWRYFGPKKTILATVIVLAILAFVPPIRARLALGLKDPSSSAHWNLMSVGINKLGLDPLLGNGLGGFPETLKQVNFQGEILNYPHNIFLNFWLEMGVLGLLAFAGICILVFEQAKKHPSALRLASGVFLMIIILHGLVDAPYFKNDLAILFWFIITLAFI